MKNKNLLDGLGGIDHDLIEEAERYPKRRKIRRWTKIGALAASLAVAVSLGLLLPRWRDNQAAIADAHKLTGVQELIFGEEDMSGEKEMRIAPNFPLQTVIEARVIEILPDTYRPCEGREVRVAKLEVLDAIRGKGLPKEIYLYYRYYDTTIFNGYDRLILSVEQMGVENYMLLNTTQKQAEFFPHMFQDATYDLGYGSVIAFKDGVLDVGFWEKANYLNMEDYYIQSMLENPDQYGYPAAYGDTPDDVKDRIRQLAAKEEGTEPRDYRTAKDFFTSVESRQIQDYLSPDSGNVFKQAFRWVRMSDNLIDTVMALEYTRVVNGFLTDEVITLYLDSGKVEYSGEKYSTEDLSKLPNLGAELEKMDLFALTPPHIDLPEGMKLCYARANGFYRKAKGEVYGIICVKWQYRYNDSYVHNALLRDDYYCLYDANGNSQVLERDALKEIIGDDPLIGDFYYNLSWFKY